MGPEFDQKAEESLNHLEANFSGLLDMVEQSSKEIPSDSSVLTDYSILIKKLESKIDTLYDKFGLNSAKDEEKLAVA